MTIDLTRLQKLFRKNKPNEWLGKTRLRYKYIDVFVLDVAVVHGNPTRIDWSGINDKSN